MPTVPSFHLDTSEIGKPPAAPRAKRRHVRSLTGTHIEPERGTILNLGTFLQVTTLKSTRRVMKNGQGVMRLAGKLPCATSTQVTPSDLRLYRSPCD